MLTAHILTFLSASKFDRTWKIVGHRSVEREVKEYFQFLIA